MSYQSDVSVDEATSDGILESASDNEMHLQHRLRGERPSFVGGVEHPVVERLEMVCPKSADTKVADRREDVSVDFRR